MATFTSRNYDGRYLQLQIDEVVHPESNSSTLNWTLSSIGGSVGYYTIAATTVTIHGQQVYHNDQLSYSQHVFPVVVGSTGGSLDVPHEADGSKTVGVGFSTNIYDHTPIEYGGTMELTRIDPLHYFWVQTYDENNTMSDALCTFSLSHDDGATWTDDCTDENPLATEPRYQAGTVHAVKNIVPSEGWYLDTTRYGGVAYSLNEPDNPNDPALGAITPDESGVYKALQQQANLTIFIFFTQNPKYYFDVSIIDDKGVERHGQDEGEHASIATVVQSNNGGESWEDPQSNEWPWEYWPIGTQHWLKDFTPIEGWYLKSVVLAVMDTEFSESNGTKLKPDKDGIYKIPQEAYRMSVRFFCVQGGTEPQNVYIGTDGSVYARRYVTLETDHVEITPDGEVHATAFTEGESFGISLGEVMAKAFRIGTPE